MKKVRWGMVSAGRIANTFAQDMKFADNAEIVSVAARKLEDAEAFAKQYGIAKAVQGYDALFTDPDIDAVYISTPHAFHLEQSIAAMEQGKHVLCEKPITMTPEECEQLISVAKNKNLFLMEAMWTWYLPAIKQAQQWLADGKIGQIEHIQANFGFKMPYTPETREWAPELGGGCLLDMGIYPIAFSWLFTKEFPQNIQAAQKIAPIGVERHVSALLEYPTTFTEITVSFSSKLHNWGFIYGTDGYIAIPNFWSASQALLYQGDEQVESFNDKRVGSGFEFQIQNASAAILNGEKQSDIVTLEDSVAFQKIMQMVKQAASVQ